MKKNPEQKSILVPQTQAGTKLGQFLQEELELSGREVKRLLEKRHCRIRGKIETFASYRLEGGESISFLLPTQKSEKPLSRLEILPQSILYEDESLLIYDKPAGYPSAPTEDPSRPNLYDFLKNYLQQRDRTSIWMIHRLDRDTSGVILFLKQKTLKEPFEALFRERQIHKVYEALADGQLKPPEGKIISYLKLLDKAKGWERWGSAPKNGKYAETGYKVLQYWPKVSHVRLFPKTGRIHQLRVHLNEQGHPILGDFFYGKHFRFALFPPRHLLHACSIRFIHPLNHQEIQVESPLPKDFQAILKQLG